jgi:hypothetical protein
VSQCNSSHVCHTCNLCHTCRKSHCHVSLDIKCVTGGLLVTDFNKVWGGVEKVIPRPSADYFVARCFVSVYMMQ